MIMAWVPAQEAWIPVIDAAFAVDNAQRTVYCHTVPEDHFQFTLCLRTFSICLGYE